MIELEGRFFAERTDLHWLALRLYRGLGNAELPVVRRHNMSLWGYEVLILLIERPGSSQVDIAVALDLDKNKVVRVVDELEAAGFAVRDADRTDRRRHKVTATAAGRQACAAVTDSLQEIEEALLSALPLAQRGSLRDGLRHLVTALDDACQAASPISAT
ncbi:MarR family winged helix-turn-helix transcriptional regulator [Nocardia niigatensis]|uniref:MarR family winged helix-turn-helix transcriptional regulator n=1 Tax=Nocardia niigatensis TaxID=209249 RepID=UPI00068812A7|nr:MarR family winged helix-turn-helix transcriptional regulator [Nocardia niigatensis]